MAVNVYEGMFILDSNRYSRDAAGVSGQIPEMIQKLGGEMLASRCGKSAAWRIRSMATARAPTGSPTSSSTATS